MEKKLWFDGKENHPVELVKEVKGGWLIKLPSGILVGPVEESDSILR